MDHKNDDESASNNRLTLLTLRVASMALVAPSSSHRLGVAAFARWAESLGLQALPSSADVIGLYSLHRLHLAQVDTTTVAHDVEAISAWHISAAVAFEVALPNPAKAAHLRFQQKKHEKHLKKKVSATEKWSLRELVLMIRGCPLNTAFGCHQRLCLTALSFGILRRGAAASIRLRRTSPSDPLSFADDSDVRIATHPTLGRYVVMAIHTDKNAVPGRPRYVYIPQYTTCGVDFVSYLIHYLTTYDVPDGFLFSAPTGKHGRSFRKTPYTAWDEMVKRCYLRVYPNGEKKVASHSCRKSVIQMIFNQGLPEAFLGDIVGWLSVKSTVLKYCASLAVEHAITIMATLSDVASSSLTTTSFDTRP